MGSWGTRAFDNDAVLDLAPLQLTSESGVRASLEELLEADRDDQWPNGPDEMNAAFGAAEVIAAALALYKDTLMRAAVEQNRYVALGAAEVIAAAHAGETYWQSEGTTLFANDLPGQAETVPYLPEEVAAFVETRPAFTEDDVRLALQALDVLDKHDVNEGWVDLEARIRAVDETRQRLRRALPTPTRG